MSEEHLIASTVKTLCRGMRYPNCDIRALFMISINFNWRHVDIPRARERSRKIPRAHGGCLGTGSRRRTRQAAIIPGEEHTSFDPGVSEWANPSTEAWISPPRTHRGGEDDPGN